MEIVKVKFPPFWREPLEFPPSILSDNVSLERVALERVALLTLNRAAIYPSTRVARWIDNRWDRGTVPLGGTLAIYRTPDAHYFIRLPVDSRREPWPALHTIMIPIEAYLGAELPEPTDQAAISAVSTLLSRSIEYIYDPQRTVIASEEVLRFNWPAYYSQEYVCQKRIYSNKTMAGAVVRSFGMHGDGKKEIAYRNFSNRAELDSWAASMTTGQKVMEFFRIERIQYEPYWKVWFRNGGPFS